MSGRSEPMDHNDAQERMLSLLAQERLTLDELQAFHRALDQEKGFDTDILRNVAYLVGELGEVVGAIQAMKEAQGDTAVIAAAQEELGAELADCLAYVLKLANCAGVDLQQAYVKKMRRNVHRVWHRPSL